MILKSLVTLIFMSVLKNHFSVVFDDNFRSSSQVLEFSHKKKVCNTW